MFCNKILIKVIFDAKLFCVKRIFDINKVKYGGKNCEECVFRKKLKNNNRYLYDKFVVRNIINSRWFSKKYALITGNQPLQSKWC